MKFKKKMKGNADTLGEIPGNVKKPDAFGKNKKRKKDALA